MKVASQQSRDGGFYEFDRQFRKSDLVKIPGVLPEEIGNWRGIVYSGTPWVPIDFVNMYSCVLESSSESEDKQGYDEIKDTVQCLVDAGYKAGYESFYLAKVSDKNSQWHLGKKFGFLSWSMSFSVQTPYSMTVCHMDHNFELVNGEKVRRGGFLKDYLNRKILIAVEDWKPGQAFCLGTQVWKNWKAGDAVILKNAMPHYGHNFTEHDRIFLMISGVVTQEWCEKYGC